MNVYSFVQDGIELKPVEVEVSLAPGLPQIQFLGRADAVIKESQLRIKTALRAQGFSTPKNQQIIVNLRPAYQPKKSNGLELAIISAYLWMSGQVQRPSVLEGEVYIYGEIGLDGSVKTPPDLAGLRQREIKGTLLTGPTDCDVDCESYEVSSLSELGHPDLKQDCEKEITSQRPDFQYQTISKQAAQWLKVAALGEHSIMLAGPAGSGKTSFCKLGHALLEEPSKEDWRWINYISQYFGRHQTWRPMVAPHHSIPSISMIGGGVPPGPGEITRAHRGMLLLDEFLEFKEVVRESLREPIETGKMIVTRRGVTTRFPADFLLWATTNLCPCGKFVPNKNVICNYSLRRCRSHLERMGGPLLDRFDLLAFTDGWQTGETVEVESAYADIKRARFFAQEKRSALLVNAKHPENQLTNQVKPGILKIFFDHSTMSYRRKLSVLKVARSLADLDQSLDIELRHLVQSKKMAFDPFWQIRQLT